MNAFSQSAQAASLELRNISKVYQTKKGEVTAVSEANLQIEAGEFLTLLGPSGCGKTTILRMIAGFETPTTGEVLLDGHDIVKVSPAKRPMSMVFQSYALFPHLSVRSNVAFGLNLQKDLSKSTIKERVDRAMQAMDILEYADRGPHELSGGQQQRVALARALVMEPRVLLFDEPLSNLDAKLREQMRYEIRKLQQELGITSIFVTHDQDEAMSMSDKIVVMQRGKIAQIGTPQEVYRYPSSRFVAEFLGSANFFPVSASFQGCLGDSEPASDAFMKVRAVLADQPQIVKAARSIAFAPETAGAVEAGLVEARRVEAGASSVGTAETVLNPAGPAETESIAAKSTEAEPAPVKSTATDSAAVSSQEALLVLRAEDIYLSDPSSIPPEQAWQLPGVVSSAIFHGDAISYLIDTANYGKVKVKVSGKTQVRPVGTEVALTLKAANAWVIPQS